MGGARVTWRLVRQVILLASVAAMGVVVVAPAVASSSGAVPAPTMNATVHRVTLTPDAGTSGSDQRFTATVEASDDGGASWGPAVGEAVTFAYVTDGAGAVTAVNGGPVGSMSGATDAAGQSTITVRTDAPGVAAVTASARGQSASVLLP